MSKCPQFTVCFRPNPCCRSTSTSSAEAGVASRSPGRWNPKRSSTRSNPPDCAAVVAPVSPHTSSGAPVRSNASDVLPTTVVVNGAEGEPGTYKDRTLLQLDPYSVIEGALIAALAVGADQIVFGLKAAFADVVARGTRRGRRDDRGGVDARNHGRPVRRTRRVLVRRGDRAPRDHRRPLPVPTHRPAVPARCR